MTSVSTFSIRLFLALVVVLGIHLLMLSVLEFPLFENRILTAYLVNFILAFAIYAGMNKLKDTQPNNLGFIFMMGSMIKFGVFFILFYPTYKSDGDMSSLEFSSFFIPYATSLVLETITLSKLLNSLKE